MFKSNMPAVLGKALGKKPTLPGTNMEVENGPLEDHFPRQTGGFPLSGV